MLAGVGVEINEQPERYNDTLWRSYALFPLFCHICFRHCARRNGGYPLSPVFIFNRLGIRCNDLARYPWRMPRGVWSWCCAPQGERNKTAGSPLASSVFSLLLLRWFPNGRLGFYARGDSIPIVFAPIWLLHRVSCALCFTGSLLLSYVIWDTAGSP